MELSGVYGENAAAQWLRDNGFEVLHTNWRSGIYELDIVARKEGVIHFVEVKTRLHNSLTTPEEAVTKAKFRALMTAARAYIRAFDIDADSQFDLVAVEYSHHGIHDIRYIPNAMIPRW